MKYKYKASWTATVEKYPYESETEKKIVIGYDRILDKTISYAKETADAKFCNTFEDAKQFLIEKHKKRIDELDNALSFARSCLERAESLTPNDVKEG